MARPCRRPTAPSSLTAHWMRSCWPCCGCGQPGIAHGVLGGDAIVVSDQGICLRSFRRASASAPASRLDTDLAAALAAMAVRAGAERTAAAAARVLDAGTARGALVHLQRSALDPGTVAALKEHTHLLPRQVLPAPGV